MRPDNLFSSTDATEDEIPWTLDVAIATFLHRWAFNWRGEHAVIAAELRQLITEAKEQS